MTFLEAQEGISKAWTCPVCAALVIERQNHRDWHAQSAIGLKRLDALDAWVRDDPRLK